MIELILFIAIILFVYVKIINWYDLRQMGKPMTPEQLWILKMKCEGYKRFHNLK